MTNVGDNENGGNGWLIVSKPVLRNYIYRWSSQDGSKEFGTINDIQVCDVVVTYEAYTLDAPPTGMKARNASSDLVYWQSVEKQQYDNITLNELGALKAGYGATSKSSLELEQSSLESNSTQATLTLSGGLSIQKLYNMEIKGDFSLKMSTTGESGTYYKSISVRPLWYVPQSDAKLSNYGVKPFWISSEFASSDAMPWCISWKAFDLETAAYNPTSQTSDVNGDMKSDLLLTSSDGSTLSVVSLAGNKARSQDVDFSSMGLRSLGVAARGEGNKACVWFYSDLIGKMVVGFFDNANDPFFIPVENSALSETLRVLDIANYGADARPEILVGDSATGALSIWHLSNSADGVTISVSEISPLDIGEPWDPSWKCERNVDLNGDGVNDILFYDDASSHVRTVLVSESQVVRTELLTLESGCRFLACGDFNGDRRSDLLLADVKDRLNVSLMDETGTAGGVMLVVSAPKISGCEVLACGDYDGDGYSDVALRKTASTGTALRLIFCFIKPTADGANIKVVKKSNVTLKNYNAPAGKGETYSER
ncbi:MAG: VCBS repeat-containing protein [Chitinivibrionia bacterium]|nr:VCBS repeat-containing protein [Chitinivibrionia bacterium]